RIMPTAKRWHTALRRRLSLYPMHSGNFAFSNRFLEMPLFHFLTGVYFEDQILKRRTFSFVGLKRAEFLLKLIASLYRSPLRQHRIIIVVRLQLFDYSSNIGKPLPTICE
ncbi:MAG: hypothetical protein ACI4WS_08485, partial [Oscillospiraceae bacterium]